MGTTTDKRNLKSSTYHSHIFFSFHFSKVGQATIQSVSAKMWQKPSEVQKDTSKQNAFCDVNFLFTGKQFWTRKFKEKVKNLSNT